MSLINKFSIQLYTVRNEIEALGFPAVLQKLSEIGYTGVEFAGYGGLSAMEMKSLLLMTHLKSTGAHIGISRLEEALEEELAYHKELGTTMIVVPYYPFESEEEIKALAERINAIATKIKAAGFSFAYHNHGNEFIEENGKYRLEMMMELCPDLDIQLDLFWASIMGCDCAAFIQKHAPRVVSLHIKQMDAQKNCVDLGDGVLDFKALIQAGLQNGAKSFIHEQEAFSDDAFVCLAKGYKHVMGL